jgi:biotin operon repressor
MGVVVSELSPAEQAILQYLRTQVDRLQDERYRQDARPSIANELQIAQRDLKKYTSDLRKKGYNI